MMAASARTSGTTLPVSSNLKRGSSASRKAAACCAARSRDARTRRLRVVDFVAFEAVIVFRTTGLRAVAVGTAFFAVVVRVAAPDDAGTPTAVIAVRTQNSRTAAANRTRITGKPLFNRLLRKRFGIVADNLYFATGSGGNCVHQSLPSCEISHLCRLTTAVVQAGCHDMSSGLSDSEHAVTRHTIASRGTTRIVLFPIAMIAWAVLAWLVLRFAEAPLASLYPLAVLVGGFEAIHALHVGVERIGRYLQVYYEDSLDDPRWATTAVAPGAALPGGGIDPVFPAVFVLVSALKLTFAFYVSRTLTQGLAIGAVHG